MGKGRRKKHRGREAEGRGDADVVFWWEPGGSRWLQLPLPPDRFPGGFVRGSLPGGGRRGCALPEGRVALPALLLPPGTPGIPRTLPLSSSPRRLPARRPSGDTGPCPRPQGGEVTPRSGRDTLPRAAPPPPLPDRSPGTVLEEQGVRSGGRRGSAAWEGCGAMRKKHTYGAEGTFNLNAKGMGHPQRATAGGFTDHQHRVKSWAMFWST